MSVIQRQMLITGGAGGMGAERRASKFPVTGNYGNSHG